jgi:hypothetical protein
MAAAAEMHSLWFAFLLHLHPFPLPFSRTQSLCKPLVQVFVMVSNKAVQADQQSWTCGKISDEVGKDVVTNSAVAPAHEVYRPKNIAP